VLDLEVRWSEAHPGETSTTWKILPELERRAQGEALAWVIGTDQLLSLHRWDRFPDVLSRLHWIVLDRAGASARSDVERVLSEWRASGLLDQQGRIGRSGKTIRLVPTRARELSSTQIRESFARHRRAPEGTLAREVEAHLKLHGLYGSA
jgi:nicotinate-nucleotide adenylyltransferase